jgi:hypothetical protein
MSRSGMTDRKSTARAFTVAALVSAVLFATFTFIDDESGLRGAGYAILLLIIGVAASLVAMGALAFPVFLLLLRLRLASLWTALASGLVIGAVMSAITEWPQAGIGVFLPAGWNDHAVRRISAHAAIGAVSALCFWLVRSSKMQSEAPSGR